MRERESELGVWAPCERKCATAMPRLCAVMPRCRRKCRVYGGGLAAVFGGRSVAPCPNERPDERTATLLFRATSPPRPSPGISSRAPAPHFFFLLAPRLWWRAVVARSWRVRGAFVARSWRVRGAFVARVRGVFVARSWRVRGARSWRVRGARSWLVRGSFVARSWRVRGARSWRAFVARVRGARSWRELLLLGTGGQLLFLAPPAALGAHLAAALGGGGAVAARLRPPLGSDFEVRGGDGRGSPIPSRRERRRRKKRTPSLTRGK